MALIFGLVASITVGFLLGIGTMSMMFIAKSADRQLEDELLREELAALCHEQWAGWMEYLFSKGTFEDNGTWTMPAWAVQRWKRQMETPYSELSKSERDSDRKEADRVLAVLGRHDHFA